MFRVPVSSKMYHQKVWVRAKTTSSSIRSNFIQYFINNHGHKYVKSSSVVPLSDPSVPFVNAGMNQFKGVFLGTVDPPCPRAVNSQKCVRVGGKHNDLDVVGTDGHHHTFFEMLGNWSFGDYYKKEACKMAWDLLLGPYRLKPENLVVTYFSGDPVLGLPEDTECRDIWRQIGVPTSRLRGLGAKDNFWEMGSTGPCGPCTEVHYVQRDGSLTEIWNLVFIQCNRQADGSIQGLSKQHVDTGMGLERMTAILQGVPSNYDTDLFRPIIGAIEKNSPASPYGSSYSPSAHTDAQYRRLADHARMISVCLADGVVPAANLNLKQIIRKSIKISTDVFQNPKLLLTLYTEVANTLGETYPELINKEQDAKLILQHEMENYAKLRSSLGKKWKELEKEYPEVGVFSKVELAGFAQGYKEFKQTMSKQQSSIMPGELVFKLYDTHGFQEDLIEQIAKHNNLKIDKEGFRKHLLDHKARHKTALKEQSENKGILFDESIKKLIKNGHTSTNDQRKYDYTMEDDKIIIPSLNTKLIAILNEDIQWIDDLDPNESRPYYLVTKETNFYCEEGGQSADSGEIRIKDVIFNVDSVFKIRDFVFHKGSFKTDNANKTCVKCNDNVELIINSDKRFSIMRNHTATHLLNAAIRKVLPNSVVCQIGSRVTEQGLSLNLSVYGDKLSEEVVLKAQDLIRKSIESNVPVKTRVVDSAALAGEAGVVTVPGESYPERGLRLVDIGGPLPSRELCCGTHVPSVGAVGEVVVTRIKGLRTHTPQIHALSGERAREARELFCRAEKLQQVVSFLDPIRKGEEVSAIRSRLGAMCGGAGAAAGSAGAGELRTCLRRVEEMEKADVQVNDVALQSVAEEEIREAGAEAGDSGRRFVVHFLRCSYLMQSDALERALRAGRGRRPTLVLGCAGGTILAAAHVPKELVSGSFDASRWLSCVLPVFGAALQPHDGDPALYAHMTGTKVSLITCEQLVQDAMRVAIKFAQAHAHGWTDSSTPRHQDRQHN